jgi:rare lipoprotein A
MTTGIPDGNDVVFIQNTFAALPGIMVRQDCRGVPYNLPFNTALAICLAFALLLHGCASFTRHGPPPGLTGYKETGIASYYARSFQHSKTASGEALNNNSMTAAHKTLPFGTEVKVTNIINGKSVTVRINDRGPFVKGRIIDLTRAAFSKIANLDKGVAKVEIRVVK